MTLVPGHSCQPVRPDGATIGWAPMTRLAALLILTVLSAGCATTRAQTPVERPALDVPPAPPRVIDPAPMPEASQPPLVEDLPPAPAPAPVTRPRGARDTAKPEAQKPEPKPETPAAATETAPPPAAQPAAAPVPTLRTPATADTAAAERRIRDVLSRAQSGLAVIDYQRLSVQRKGAYDQAKDFIDGAEAAIKASNFELGMEMADKADKLVRELSGR